VKHPSDPTSPQAVRRRAPLCARYAAKRQAKLMTRDLFSDELVPSPIPIPPAPPPEAEPTPQIQGNPYKDQEGLPLW